MRGSRVALQLALYFVTSSTSAHETSDSTAKEDAQDPSHQAGGDEPAPADSSITVVVLGHAPVARPVSTTIVTSRDRAAVPSRSAEDALELVPGLTLVQHGAEGKAQQYFLRGFDAMHGSDIELTVAGIPINEWSNVHSQGYIDLGFVVPEAVQSITVSKGPFSVDQGPFATAGSVNYALGVPEDKLGLWARYTAGTTNRQRGVVTYSPKGGDGRDFVALEGMHDDSFGQNRAANRASLLGQISTAGSVKRGKLSLLGSAYWAEFRLPGALKNKDVELGRIGFYDSYDPAGHGSSSRALLGVRHSIEAAEASIETTAFAGLRHLKLLENYTGYLLDPRNGDRRQQSQNTVNVGFLSKTLVPLTETSDFEAGLGVRGDGFEQFQDHLGQQEQVIATERSLAGFQLNTHVLLGVRLRLGHHWSARVGARFDYAHITARDLRPINESGTGDWAIVSPRGVLNYRPGSAWIFSVSGGQGFRPPEARALTPFQPKDFGLSSDLYVGGTPAMTPAYSVELGARYQPSSTWGMSASGYGTWLDRESIYDHVSGVNLELNGTRRLGGELEIHGSPWDFLTVRADATLVDARFATSGQPIPFAPTGTLGARAIFAHPSGVRAGARFLGLLPRPLPHGAVAAPLMNFDVSAGYTYRNWSLDLELENVLDLRVRDGEYHYTSRFYPEVEESRLPELHFVAGPPRNLRVTLSTVF